MEQREPGEPQIDADFFNELRTVFEKYPDATRKYSISLRQHTDISSAKNLEIAGSKRMCLEWYREGGRWKCAKWAWE